VVSVGLVIDGTAVASSGNMQLVGRLMTTTGDMDIEITFLEYTALSQRVCGSMDQSCRPA